MHQTSRICTHPIAKPPLSRSAFTLIELLVVITVIGILTGIILPALANTRKTARATVCKSNLRQFGTSAATYSIDFKGTIFSFTWNARQSNSAYPDLAIPPNSSISDIEAGARQATDIIRRRSPSQPNFAQPTPWIPCVDYSHLVLLDYMSVPLPVPIAACPEDKPLQLWQSDIPGFNQGAFGVMQPRFDGFEGSVMRAKPYSSSYEVVPASYDRSPASARVAQGSGGQYYYSASPATKIGNVRVDQVTFPSLKVHMFDTFQRHGRRQLFFAHADTVQPVLQFDSSVPDRRTKDVGYGWQPNAPASPAATNIFYTPYQYEPPTSNRTTTETFFGRYRWTRGGIRGSDYGNEVTGVP